MGMAGRAGVGGVHLEARLLGPGYAAAVDVDPYAARYRSHRVGIFGVARLMNKTGAGGFGE
jgi:hypothetical protein